MPKIYKQYCKQCGKYYERPGAKLFCSLNCANKNLERIEKIKKKIPKGRRTNTGRTHFKKGDNKNEKAHNWKGDNVGYHALHYWIKKRLKKPIFCEICKKSEKLELTNKDHKYKRNLKDWRWVCRSCHSQYDKNYLNRKRDLLGRFI